MASATRQLHALKHFDTLAKARKVSADCGEFDVRENQSVRPSPSAPRKLPEESLRIVG